MCSDSLVLTGFIFSCLLCLGPLACMLSLACLVALVVVIVSYVREAGSASHGVVFVIIDLL